MEPSNEIPDNLPFQLSSFIGRKKELAQLSGLLNSNRLLTLTGTGGVGKTRLAIQLARHQIAAFPDGVFFVALAPLSNPRLVTETVAQALNLPNSLNNPIAELLTSRLQSKQILLILDNCEHLLDECARLTEFLLGKCPRLKILATSREPLWISGEVTMRVPSLDIPDLQQLPHDPAILAECEAVQLFLARVRAAIPEFSLTEKNIQPVSRICSRLDGIPLALELAAARSNGLPLELMVKHLDDSFRVLTGGSRTALPRQQTLLALLDWSFNLLDLREQVVLNRLAVFAGKWSLEAAAEICQGHYAAGDTSGEIRAEEILEAVLQLVNKSLVQMDEEGRYYLLETTRQYARKKLAAAGEAEKYFGQHRDWYVRFALEAEKELTGPHQISWKKRIVEEHAEIVTALGRSLDRGEILEAAGIVTGLWHFWFNLQFGGANEKLLWLEQIYNLSQETKLPREVEARLLNTLGIAYHSNGDFTQAEQFHLKALKLWQELGDKANTAKALMDLGWSYQFQLKVDEAAKYARESLQIARESGDRRAIAAALHLQAIALIFSNRMQEAITLIEDSQAIWRELGDLQSISSSLNLLAQAKMKLGDYREVKPLIAEAFSLLLELQNHLGAGIAFVEIARLLLATRKGPQSARTGTRLIGITHKWYQVILATGAKKPSMASVTEEAVIKELKQILGEEVYAQEYAAGLKYSREEAINLALELLKPRAEEESEASFTAATAENLKGLTEREVEVLGWVAQGLSNPQIAEKLVLSRRTVEAHLRSIFNKLEITSRAAATRYAVENKLV